MGGVSGKETKRETEGRKTTKRIEEEKYFEDESLTEYTVEEGVEEIGESAFEFCTNLRRVKMVEGVRKIGRNAFGRCYKLTEIVFEKGLEEIEKEAFHNCYALERVSFPQGLRKIGSGAFDECSKLTEIVFANPTDDVKFAHECFLFQSKSLRHVRYGPDVIDVPPEPFV